MLRVKDEKRACTMILPAKVYNQVRQVAERSGVPANRITTLALDAWLQRLYAGDPLARACTDPEVAYDAAGSARSLEEVARLASRPPNEQVS